MEAQCTYHNQAKELFETIKNNWGQGANSDSCDMMSKVMIRDDFNTPSIPHPSTAAAAAVEDVSSKSRFTPNSLRQQSPVSSSSDDYNTSIYSGESAIHHTLPTRVPPPTNLPSRQSSTHDFDKHRKALFDFTGQNDDEISFKTGDIIAVIDEIDKGWWLGEVHSKRGIFPVNYTEDYDIHVQPLPPLPHTNNNNNDTVVKETTSCTPSSIDQPVTRQPPIASSSPIPATNKGSLSRKRSTAIRAPPPPPAARVNSTDSSSTPSTNNTLSHSSHPVPHIPHPEHDYVHEEPSSYIIKSTPSSLHSQDLPTSQASSPHLSRLTQQEGLHHIDLVPVDLCGECDCQEYMENLFKKGYCNRCFHKH